MKDRKLADKDVINQGDATQIARAEAKLNDGQIPPNSVSAKAQVLVSTLKMQCHALTQRVYAAQKQQSIRRLSGASMVDPT